MSKKIDKIKNILSPSAIFFNNKYYFIDSTKCNTKDSAGDSLLGRIKSFLKKYGNLYSRAIEIFSPVKPSRKFTNLQNILISKYSENHNIVSLGSGPKIYKNRNDIINIDIFPFDNVDIVGNAVDLQLKNNSVDYIINLAMLEHVKSPLLIVNEMHKVLKPKGDLICYIPFIVPFHAAPEDYFRWTKEGAKELFKDFTNVEIGVGAGPTSALLWLFQEWVSLVFSFGNDKLKDIIFLLVMILTFPIKYLDCIFEKFPNANNLASGFYIHAKK